MKILNIRTDDLILFSDWKTQALFSCWLIQNCKCVWCSAPSGFGARGNNGSPPNVVVKSGLRTIPSNPYSLSNAVSTLLSMSGPCEGSCNLDGITICLNINHQDRSGGEILLPPNSQEKRWIGNDPSLKPRTPGRGMGIKVVLSVIRRNILSASFRPSDRGFTRSFYDGNCFII